jgi:PKD repeat protein
MKAQGLSAKRSFAPVALVSALVIAAAVVLAAPAATFAADPSGCPAADPVSIAAADCAASTPVVPSLDPAWSDGFVPPAMPRLRSLVLCRPLNAVFYAQTDWFRLAQKLRANPSSCADYYVSVPPLTADKTRLRSGEAARIRALGPQMHAIAEVSTVGWTDWVAAGNGTWFDAGVEMRRRMDAAGFDVAAGDIWGVNEFSSAVRRGDGSARADMRELVRGLSTGDGTVPAVQGVVWVVGIGQSTADLSTYKTNLKGWLQDAGFWADMSRYVRFWSQEVFGDVRDWAVPGADLSTRRDRLVDYVEHVSVLSEVSPPALADVKAFMRAADAPLANAAWAWPSTYGYTLTPSPQMQAYVASQTYALRNRQAQATWRDGDSFGFAWSPTNQYLKLPSTDFVQQGAAVLDQLAASIHASDAPSEDAGIAACGPDTTWCATDVDGASFNLAWRILGTWTQPLAVDSTATVDEDTSVKIPLVASDPDGEQLSYETIMQPQHGTLAGEGALQTYTPAHDFNGADSFTFRVSDGFMSSRVATVRIVVTPVNDAPTLELAPAGPIDEGAAPVTLTAHATDVDGDAVTYTWATTVGTVISSGDTATFAADDGPAVAHVTVSGDDGHGGTGTATIDVEIRNVPPTADAGADAEALWGLPVSLRGSATDPSATDTAAGLNASWSFGDSSPAAGGFAVSHTYADPGTYTATLTATDKDGGTGADTATLTIHQRPATVVYAGPSGLNASSAAVAARLADASGTQSARLGGHTVTLALGPNTCTATTDTTGLARCAIDASALPLGPTTVTATFAGDELYTDASASAPVVLYALPTGGIFVIGDTTAAGTVTFWSPQWRLLNGLSGGAAPANFKGFAAAAAPACGGTWTASSGFDHAPAEVPAWVAVIVATTVRKDGSTISGNTARILVIHTDAYDPAVLGRGTIAATAC